MEIPQGVEKTEVETVSPPSILSSFSDHTKLNKISPHNPFKYPVIIDHFTKCRCSASCTEAGARNPKTEIGNPELAKPEPTTTNGHQWTRIQASCGLGLVGLWRGQAASQMDRIDRRRRPGLHRSDRAAGPGGQQSRVEEQSGTWTLREQYGTFSGLKNSSISSLEPSIPL